ncbi:Protein of uncharacterised function (DUF3298) [Chlamydia trachomatis]|nr:Protein of uncharacterised function (DUF3298) [Chlamydia trachomatis]CQB88647.1 Protein of uncharacterised function (DUF3298) [Chlamydia trachomatis]
MERSRLNRALFVALLALLVSQVSCTKKKQIDSLDGLVTWETVEATEKYIDPFVLEEWKSDDEMPSCKVDIKMVYPTITDKAYTDLRDSLVKSICQRIYMAPLDDYSKEGVKAYLENYVKEQVGDYKLDLEQAKKLNFDVASYSVFTREFQYSDSVTYSEHGILSLISKTTEYSGGVHANEVVSTLNYDLNNKEPITVSSIFKNPKDPDLLDLLYDALMRSFEVKSREELEYKGVFNYHALEVTNNLFFDEEGITFYYNPYELATYAAGPIEIHLSYQALAPFFTSEFKRFEKYGE